MFFDPDPSKSAQEVLFSVKKESSNCCNHKYHQYSGCKSAPLQLTRYFTSWKAQFQATYRYWCLKNKQRYICNEKTQT